MDKQGIAKTYARRAALNDSPLVQRAVQRLRDSINRRETNLDLDAIKAVLVEMATQKERADRLEAELVEVRADRSHQRSLAESRYTDWRQQLDKTEEMRRCFENERATSTHLEQLVEIERNSLLKAKNLLAEVEAYQSARLDDLKEEQDRMSFEVVSALHDKIVLFLGHSTEG